jgi:hypothetical protein
MKVIFHKRFYEVYAHDPAAAAGRMEPIVNALEAEFEFVEPEPSFERDLERVHGREHIQSIKDDSLLYEVASIAAGGLGYLFRRMEFDVAPLVLALVLGPQIEVALRQSLNINRGNIFVFFQRSISLVFTGVIILSILSPFIKMI